jgi:hypothetical protein
MEHLKSFLRDMENKKKFEQEASEFFADNKNDNVNTLYITSDGCLFRAEHYANNWRNDLKDKALEVHHRIGKSIVDTINEGAKSKIEADKLSSIDSDQPSERDALVKEYIGLFDKKPHHMYDEQKIKDKIQAKKAELALIENTDQEDSGADQEDSGSDQDKVDDADQTDNK